MPLWKHQLVVRWRRIFIGFLIFLFVILLPAFPAGKEAKELLNRPLYAQANIWFEKSYFIPSTNYHRGRMIPVGTKVEIIHISSDDNFDPLFQKNPEEQPTIKFTVIDEESVFEGKRFSIIYISRFNPETTLIEYAQKYFSETNPMDDLENFSGLEKKNIKRGRVKIGMSKGAVFMAYGLPPSHRTPNIEKNDIWTYWVSKFKRKKIYFDDDGRVDEIE